MAQGKTEFTCWLLSASTYCFYSLCIDSIIFTGHTKIFCWPYENLLPASERSFAGRQKSVATARYNKKTLPPQCFATALA
jgi:hypothetical protein